MNPNKTSILITGGNGIVGRYTAEALKNRGFQVTALSRAQLDVSDLTQVETVFQRYQPNAVFHFAALTDLKQCEENHSLADSVNIEGTAHIISQCRLYDSLLIYASTYYVYASNIQAYWGEDYEIAEHELPNHYTWTKYQAEKLVRQLPHYYIARLGSLFGGGALDKKIVTRIYHQLKAHEKLQLVSDQLFQPTFSGIAAQHLIDLLDRRPETGIYNITSEGACSFYECGQWIAKLLNKDESLISAISIDEYKVTVKQRYIMASLEKIKKIQMTPFFWQHHVRSYIRELEDGIGPNL